MNYFKVLVMGGGVIGWVLWAVSIGTVAMIVQYLLTIRRKHMLPDRARSDMQRLLQAKQYAQSLELAGKDAGFLGCMVGAALRHASGGYAAMERAMEEAAEGRATSLLRQVEWLNLIGNISPMLGLLGTVWGMINAFFTIVQAGGQVDAGKLAGSIGIALVTTLLGLAIAIPALAAYSVMRNRIDALITEAMVVCQELLAGFRPGGERPTP